MIGQNINIGTKKLRVLVSPLDWGLGHATRIITIVKILQNHDVQVLIAAENPVAGLLKTEFPGVDILPLKGYRVKYSKGKKNFYFKLLQQIPGIFYRTKAENQWLKGVIKEHAIDAVISDNRFGLYHQSVPSVYITHQLFIETGKRWLNNIAQKIHYSYINRFSECWVPDYEEEQNLAGKLSHPKKMPAVPVKYLGPLSRFKQVEKKTISNDLMIMLSGPEPLRTIWEEALLQQIQGFEGRIILVRGKPGCHEKIDTTSNVAVYNHLAAEELYKIISSSEIVLCRSGYSTVMDLIAMGKKAILVPTPGQQEQEYLAEYLKEKKLFYGCSQAALQLHNAIAIAKNFSQEKFPSNFLPQNERIIKDWLVRLRESK